MYNKVIVIGKLRGHCVQVFCHFVFGVFILLVAANFFYEHYVLSLQYPDGWGCAVRCFLPFVSQEVCLDGNSLSSTKLNYENKPEVGGNNIYVQ